MSPEDLNRLLGYIPRLLPGLAYTISVPLVTMTLATLLGCLVAVLLVSPRRAVRVAVRTYIDVARAIPELVWIFIFYGLLPFLPLFPIVLDGLQAVVIALTIVFGAFLGEVIRGGINGVEPTQWEAGQVLGMSRPLMWRRIILPQAARNIGSQNFRYFELYAIVLVAYYVIGSTALFLIRRLERRWNVDARRIEEREILSATAAT